MNTDLKVSFYLKRTNKGDGNTVYPIVDKIIIGKSIVQFGCKLKVDKSFGMSSPAGLSKKVR